VPEGERERERERVPPPKLCKPRHNQEQRPHIPIDDLASTFVGPHLTSLSVY